MSDSLRTKIDNLCTRSSGTWGSQSSSSSSTAVRYSLDEEDTSPILTYVYGGDISTTSQKDLCGILDSKSCREKEAPRTTHTYTHLYTYAWLIRPVIRRPRRPPLPRNQKAHSALRIPPRDQAPRPVPAHRTRRIPQVPQLRLVARLDPPALVRLLGPRPVRPVRRPVHRQSRDDAREQRGRQFD